MSLASEATVADTFIYRNIICGYIHENWAQWERYVILHHGDQNLTKEMYRVKC